VTFAIKIEGDNHHTNRCTFNNLVNQNHSENPPKKGKWEVDTLPDGDVAKPKDPSKKGEPLKVDLEKKFNPFFNGTEKEKAVGKDLDVPKEFESEKNDVTVKKNMTEDQFKSE
jgi:hypothetical protein